MNWLLSALCIVACVAFFDSAVEWSYQHEAMLHMQESHAIRQAVTRARDMQKLADHRQLLRCQERVMMDGLHEQTARMVAHSALKHAGMEQ